MSAFGELVIGGCALCALAGLYFLLSSSVPIVPDAPPGIDPPRRLSGARLAIGLVLIAFGVLGVMFVIAGAGLGRLASH